MKIKTIITTTLLFGLLAVSVYKGASYIKHYTSDFIDHTLHSSVMGESRKIFIRLPNDYDAQNSYPLIIKTDGNFNLDTWHTTLSAQTKDIDDAILVAIPNQFWTNTRNRDLVPPFARKDVNIDARPVEEADPEIFGKADVFLRFISQEVLPYVQQNYAVSDERILSGFSAGGSFVIYTMITQPDLFTGYFAFSPAAWYDDSVVVKEFSENITNLAGEPKYFYLSIGAQENDIITGSFNGLVKTLQDTAPSNLQWQHHFVAGAGHNETPVKSVPKALSAYAQFKHTFL